MDIITLIATQIGIGITWLHYIDGSHQSRLLVGRITISNDVFNGRTQFDITALFQPSRNTSIIKVAGS